MQRSVSETMMIPEIEAYRFYRWTTNSRQVSFAEFKENLLKAGYVIYSIDSEAKPVIPDEFKRKKT
jgi:uncharacterized protein YbcV (DUF1398 family)